MNKFFAWMGKKINGNPFKIIFISIVAFAIMISGAIKINMATGSETLVRVDNEAYINNYKMEDNFGGDAIMILVKGDQEQLLSLSNLEKLWNVEQRLKYNEDIFSIMSPSSIVHQITDKQTSEIKKQVLNMKIGLNSMSEKLAEISVELNEKNFPDLSSLDDMVDNIFESLDFEVLLKEIMYEQELALKSQFNNLSAGLNEMGLNLIEVSKRFGNLEIPDTTLIEEKLNDLENITKVFDQLINGQSTSKLTLNNLKDNLTNSSTGLSLISEEILAISSDLDNGDLKEKLILISEKLSVSSQGISQTSTITEKLSEGSNNTVIALDNIKTNLASTLEQIKNNLNMEISKDQIIEMSHNFNEMGLRLQHLSSNLKDKLSNGSLLVFDDSIINSIKDQMSQEFANVKAGLDISIDPKEFKKMANGFGVISENLLNMSNGLEIFNEKSNMLLANFPHNQNELNSILYEDDKLREVFNDTIIDDQHLMMIVKLNGNVSDSVIDSVYSDVLKAIEQEDFKVETIISGKPVLDSSLREEMKSNMVVMIASAVVLMFIILSLVFKVRWRILSLLIIFISVFATLGLMGHLNVSMTMVSMAVFPILIGLGIDYSIQFHNRYEEELSTEITLRQIGKSVGIAVLATIFGFASLFISPVPMIQDFGKMLTIGVIVSFIGSIILLLPTLRARDLVNNKVADKKSNEQESTIINKLLIVIEKFVVKFAYVIIIIAIMFSFIGFYADTKVGVETDIETFMPQDMQALSDIHYIRDTVGSTNQMVLYMGSNEMFTEVNIDYVRELTKTLEDRYSDQIVDIKSINNVIENMYGMSELSYEEYLNVIKNDIPNSQRKMFVSDGFDKSVIIMNVEHMATEDLQEFVSNLNRDITDAPLDIAITGKSVLDIEMVKGLTDGRLQMTSLGLALVFLVLLIMYRSFIKAFVAILPVSLIVGMSGGVMNILNLKYTPITATLGALVLGMGTEMTIMLLERYLEERSNKSKSDALFITMQNIGKATLASGLTTVGGFSVLMLSKFVILKDFGLMTVINISLALIATFIILPSLIWILDKYLVKKQ